MKMETEIKVGTNLYRYVSNENGFIEKYFGVMTEKLYENIEDEYRLSFAYKIRDLKEFIVYNSTPLEFDNYRQCGFFLSPGMAINDKIKVFKNHIKRLKGIYRNYINDEKI